MNFHTYTTMRDWARRVNLDDHPLNDVDLFYKRILADAVDMGSPQFFAQMIHERDLEWAKAVDPEQFRKGAYWQHYVSCDYQ